MTLNDKIIDFINVGLTKSRAIASELLTCYDRDGYQSPDSKDRLMRLYELRNFTSLLLTSDKGEMSSKQINDTIDFFTEWCNLNNLTLVQYTNYSTIIDDNNKNSIDSSATLSDLNLEVAARQSGDLSLSSRITYLENNQLDPTTFFPDKFFDNVKTTFVAVFNDDARLHSHANKSNLDLISDILIAALQSLPAHYLSLGNPNGIHVSSVDRMNWNAKVTTSQLTALSNIYAAINHHHQLNEIDGLTDLIHTINHDITNMAAADGKSVELQRSGDNIQWRLMGDLTWIDLGDFKGSVGDPGVPFNIGARGNSVNRFSSVYNTKDDQFTFLEEDTGYLYYRNPLGGPATGPAGWNNGIQFLGHRGWSPVFAAVEVDSSKTILELIDWVGGQGIKPVLDAGIFSPAVAHWYLGSGGFTLFQNSATNFKGPKGSISAPKVNIIGNLSERTNYDTSVEGFTFLRNDISPQTIFIKNSDAPGDWSPELPWQGPPGSSGGIAFLNNIDTTGMTITLNMGGLTERMFRCSPPITSAKSWLLTNDGNAVRIPSLLFQVDAGQAQTYPANFIMSDSRWDTSAKTWTPLDSGIYMAHLIFNGTYWLSTIDGPFN